ncbi:hypothetical protein ABH911_004234 [Pseudomonas protegens]|uniref:hypothetical protein n=1 Tax=Pseudomonas TaxID=286 RepID=UPI00087605C7|nr:MULTISPECIES: hypothetical protein [Pseudomonas]PNV94844.1 hypothetical protein C1633_28090 [Pseudomonas protegens]SCZ75153.1 hypothetical protein SAMN03159460_05424 [Pseudomonas sp. NFPP17]SDA86905.1 hypothetical protein SAMN03159464_05608 [Pseudomonas sp. NFPP15]SEL90151.1 hypothetical protein SAMN03159324_05712 [Pseudomonas sp. NFPP18]SFA67613.1 hypothetical protein SAMN03159320_05499 [Pseudomonas sp. NFPP13]
MDILNNREIAIALWLILAATYIFSAKRMREVRSAFKRLIFVFQSRPLMIVFSLAVVYTVGMVYLLLDWELWNIDQLKNTVFWFFSVGLLSIYNLDKIKIDPHFFKNSVIGSLRLLAILQFVIGIYSLPLLAELFLVPFMVAVGTMIAIAESDIKYLQVKKLLNGIVISFGLFTLVYTAYMLATDFKELGQEKTFYDFVVPALLTVMYLPFVFAIMTYSTYETVFVRLQFTVQDKKLRNLAKLYTVLLFNFRLDDIRRWADHIARVDVISHKQLLSTFVHLRKLKKLEKMKPEVVGSQGWSPYLAKDFLLSKGVSTGHYNLIFSDQWCASSKMHDIGDDLLCDNFAYYVEGVEGVAKVLKIKLNVNDNSRARQANERLLVLSRVLVRESLGIDISDSVKDALRFGAQHCESHGDKQIIVKKTSWGGHKLGGYDLKIEVVAT